MPGGPAAQSEHCVCAQIATNTLDGAADNPGFLNVCTLSSDVNSLRRSAVFSGTSQMKPLLAQQHLLGPMLPNSSHFPSIYFLFLAGSSLWRTQESRCHAWHHCGVSWMNPGSTYPLRGSLNHLPQLCSQRAGYGHCGAQLLALAAPSAPALHLTHSPGRWCPWRTTVPSMHCSRALLPLQKVMVLQSPACTAPGWLLPLAGGIVLQSPACTAPGPCCPCRGSWNYSTQHAAPRLQPHLYFRVVFRAWTEPQKVRWSPGWGRCRPAARTTAWPPAGKPLVSLRGRHAAARSEAQSRRCCRDATSSVRFKERIVCVFKYGCGSHIEK